MGIFRVEAFTYIITSNTFIIQFLLLLFIYQNIKFDCPHIIAERIKDLDRTKHKPSYRSSDMPTALNATSIQGDRYTPQRYYAH